MNIISTKQEGESHSSIFYGLFENEKINKSHVVTTRNTIIEDYGGGLFSLNGDLLFSYECGQRDATQERERDDDDDDVYFRFYSLSFMEKYNGGLFSNAGAVVVCNYVVEKRRVWTT
jgi:hypothetical protein